MPTETIIDVQNLRTCFDDFCVHEDVNFSVKRGEIIAIVGGSGTGKTTLLHELIMLRQPTAGNIYVYGKLLTSLSTEEANALKKRIGVLFQKGALFSSLSVIENIAAPLKEHTDLDDDLIEQICHLKLMLVGLDADVANRYPQQLSGGMVKRAALARALALDPGLLFLDEPSAGLDPISAHTFDELILQLRDSLDLTVVMVTHDMDTLWHITDKVAFLGEKRILSYTSMASLSESTQPLIMQFIQGPRGRNARINQ